MRILSLVFAVALLVACEKAATRTEHNVEVKRQIPENAAVGDTIWTMRVDSSGIDFSHWALGSMSDRMYTVKFRGTDGQNALSVFNTFAKWAATARANRVEPFSKRIPSDCGFSTFRSR